MPISRDDHARNWDRCLDDFLKELHHHRAERIRILEAKDEQLTLNLELDDE